MSAKDELREGLRKRGESWHKWPDEDSTTWQAYSDPHTATESMDGTLIVTGLTPEQAITATLEPRTCRLVETEHEGEIFDDGYYMYLSFDCDECGHENAEYGRFCAGCGRKVVGE